MTDRFNFLAMDISSFAVMRHLLIIGITRFKNITHINESIWMVWYFFIKRLKNIFFFINRFEHIKQVNENQIVPAIHSVIHKGTGVAISVILAAIGWWITNWWGMG